MSNGSETFAFIRVAFAEGDVMIDPDTPDTLRFAADDGHDHFDLTDDQLDLVRRVRYAAIEDTSS